MHQRLGAMRFARVLTVVSAGCLLLACSADPAATAGPSEATIGPVVTSTTMSSGETTAVTSAESSTAPVETVQLPGSGSPGVEIALGEWALVPSAVEAPPGMITFRFRNLGTVPHALRIRTAGSGDNRLEWRAEAVSPGETALLVADLAPGTYEIDCPIEDAHGEHDQLGMEMIFTVHEGATSLTPLPDSPATEVPASDEAASSTAVTIAEFAFAPAELGISVGSTVTWSNSDPTPHTVTSDDFDTGPIDQGASGTVTFPAAGSFEYFCAIHPTMRGRVVVEP
ncbi:MAG TPA: cupredoxin domain-containing protein [Acidimicrobiia bacterium]|nr:cupredoxin domain-containing protein [Acidimicrobiia bacterium]